MTNSFHNLIARRAKQLKITLIIAILVLILSIGIWGVFTGLPSKQEIQNFRIASTVDSFTNVNWQGQKPIRKVVPLSAISDKLQKSVIISEDDLFYQHHGFNFQMIKEAFKVNLERKRYARGASTITMQLARNAFLTKEKSVIRKIREIIVARRIEDVLSKNRILELYLNRIEWGPDIYGAEAAAHYYFGKSAQYLTWGEASLLAGILPNPKRFNPLTRIQIAKKFQKRVVDLLRLSKVIDKETAAYAYKSQIYLRGAGWYPPLDTLTYQVAEQEDMTFSEPLKFVEIDTSRASTQKIANSSANSTLLDSMIDESDSMAIDTLINTFQVDDTDSVQF